MIIRVILLLGLAAVLVYALSQRRRSRLVSLVIMASAVAGGFFFVFPDTTNLIAHRLGVGRGVDLITYVFIVISLAAILNLHLRLRAASEVATDLARAIALISARRLNHVPSSGPNADSDRP